MAINKIILQFLKKNKYVRRANLAKWADRLRPFDSLVIWNGLDMRDGLVIFTGLGI